VCDGWAMEELGGWWASGSNNEKKNEKRVRKCTVTMQRGCGACGGVVV
jgi:hypothetical protein